MEKESSRAFWIADDLWSARARVTRRENAIGPDGSRVLLGALGQLAALENLDLRCPGEGVGGVSRGREVEIG
jgi:hypothetical protein